MRTYVLSGQKVRVVAQAVPCELFQAQPSRGSLHARPKHNTPVKPPTASHPLHTTALSLPH